MAFTVVPHKHVQCGMALQTALGVPAAVATMVFPLPEGTDFGPKWSNEVYQNNQGNYEETHYYSSGYTTEGTIKIPLVPGMLTSTVDLYKWAFDRSADTTYWQGLYASFFINYGQGVYKRFRDVKCTGGTFSIDKGKPVYLDCKALGGHEPEVMTSACIPSYTTGVWFDGVAPYHSNNATITLGDKTGLSPTVLAAAADNFTKNHSIEWDNRVMSASDASTLLPGIAGPYGLPNVARAAWSGSFTRWFTDTWLTTAGMTTGYEGQFALGLTSATKTLAMTFPRIIFVDGTFPKLPGDGIVQNDGLSWKALGGLGTPGTACFTLAESAV